MLTETWAIDGVDLLTLASNVARLDVEAVAPFRGEDRVLALQDGRTWRPKQLDAATITLGIMVLGDDDDPAAATARAGGERLLLALLRPPHRQVELRRTWTDDLGEHVAVALAETQSVNRKRHGNGRVALTAELTLAAPWFHAPEQSIVLPVGVPVAVDNPGEWVCTAVALDLSGQLVNPTVTNSTPSPEVWAKVGSAVASGDVVTVDVSAATVLRRSDGANLIGALTHSGSRAWFGLARGANVVTLSADGGAGNAVLRFRPVYF